MILTPLATDAAIQAHTLDALEALCKEGCGRWPALYLALVERLQREQNESTRLRDREDLLQAEYDRLASVEAALRQELAEERRK